MSNESDSGNPKCAQESLSKFPRDTDTRIHGILRSRAIGMLESTLRRLKLTIEPEPILHKYVTDRYLRVMFPVTGASIESGAVVSVACLHDCKTDETLYAHPMHAGSDVNPLLRHLDAPMAAPKAQPGKDGDRATLRMIEHKRSLWDRFLLDCHAVGEPEAGRKWRKDYYQALRRLYFCTTCPQCKWGDPFFEGPDPALPGKEVVSAFREAPAQPAPARFQKTIDDILGSDAWLIESRYAGRGGFSVATVPRLAIRLTDDHLQVVFPTNAVLIQAGTLVAVSVIYNQSERSVEFAQCLSAGPEAELLFLHGDRALGLPLPQPSPDDETARTDYLAWRRDAWQSFWLEELEGGIDVASRNWLRSFWTALDELFDGNNLTAQPGSPDASAAGATYPGHKIDEPPKPSSLERS